MEDQKVKEILIEKNPEFKKLFLNHQRFEEELARLQQKKGKDDAEATLEKNIKKQKLKVKDAMQKMICDFKEHLH